MSRDSCPNNIYGAVHLKVLDFLVILRFVWRYFDSCNSWHVMHYWTLFTYIVTMSELKVPKKYEIFRSFNTAPIDEFYYVLLCSDDKDWPVCSLTICLEICWGKFLILGSRSNSSNIFAAAVMPFCMLEEKVNAFPIDQELDMTTSNTLPNRLF